MENSYDILGEEHAVFPIAPPCQHPEEAKFTKTLSSIVNCETTVIACRDCGEELTEPKTDCT